MTHFSAVKDVLKFIGEAPIINACKDLSPRFWVRSKRDKEPILFKLVLDENAFWPGVPRCSGQKTGANEG